jgi:hypothetical protein
MVLWEVHEEDVSDVSMGMGLAGTSATVTDQELFQVVSARAL